MHRHRTTGQVFVLATALVIAPFEYLALPINILWGLLLWQEIPLGDVGWRVVDMIRWIVYS